MTGVHPSSLIFSTTCLLSKYDSKKRIYFWFPVFFPKNCSIYPSILSSASSISSLRSSISSITAFLIHVNSDSVDGFLVGGSVGACSGDNDLSVISC